MEIIQQSASILELYSNTVFVYTYITCVKVTQVRWEDEVKLKTDTRNMQGKTG